MHWDAVLFGGDPMALKAVRVILIGLLLVMSLTSTSIHLKWSSLLYAVWKTIEYFAHPTEPLTLNHLLLFAAQAYLFLAVMLGVERVRVMREDLQRMRQAIADLSASR